MRDVQDPAFRCCWLSASCACAATADTATTNKATQTLRIVPSQFRAVAGERRLRAAATRSVSMDAARTSVSLRIVIRLREPGRLRLSAAQNIRQAVVAL